MTTVHNLRTGQTAEYSVGPQAAVMAAHAQFDRHDWNTWEYEQHYANQVGVTASHAPGQRTWICGDWATHEKVTPCK